MLAARFILFLGNREGIHSADKLNRILKVVHGALVPVAIQLGEHVHQPGVQRREAHLEPLGVDWLVLKIKSKGVSVVGEAVGLNAATNPFELTTPSFKLADGAHRAGLFVGAAGFADHPHCLDDVAEPAKGRITFVFRTLLPLRRHCCRILYSKILLKHAPRNIGVRAQVRRQ